MSSLEHIKLLESKVAKAIDFIERISDENAALQQRDKEMQTRLTTFQKRIDELEVIITQFREEHGQIENGILAALDRLNQFEKVMEKSLHGNKVKTSAKEPAAKEPVAKEPVVKQQSEKILKISNIEPSGEESSETEKICFEIPENGDIADPLTDTLNEETEGEELDIF